VLLIGTNPLPNFVVADYFLQENPKLEKIWLVYSEKNNFQSGTKEQADNLETILEKRWKQSRPDLFPLKGASLSDVSHAVSIQNDIRQQMLDKLNVKKGIHLNYTGGTKSMSTHIYWILKELNKVETQFSYLDARNFRLISDEEGVIENDLRKKVSLSMDEMIQIHGFERKNKSKDFVFSEGLEIFRNLIENDRLKDFYGQGGYNREMFVNDKGKFAEKVKDISKSNLECLKEFKPNEIFLSVIQKMPEEYRIFDISSKFNENMANKKFDAAVRFFDGEWLEYHIFDTIKTMQIENKISVEQNWVIKNPAWEKQNSELKNLDFELDVILINGYQLTGISCTTDKGKYCKNKGFEIIHRTRQIGGDESKSILVSGMNDKNRDQVQAELMYDTGGNKGNILVLGEEDLKKETLIREIKKFVFSE